MVPKWMDVFLVGCSVAEAAPNCDLHLLLLLWTEPDRLIIENECRHPQISKEKHSELDSYYSIIIRMKVFLKNNITCNPWDNEVWHT